MWHNDLRRASELTSNQFSLGFILKDENGIEKGDVFYLFDYIFNEDHHPSYHEEMPEHKNDPSTLTDDEAF